MRLSSYTFSGRFIAAKKRQVYLGAHKGTTRLGAQKGSIPSDGDYWEPGPVVATSQRRQGSSMGLLVCQPHEGLYKVYSHVYGVSSHKNTTFTYCHNTWCCDSRCPLDLECICRSSAAATKMMSWECQMKSADFPQVATKTSVMCCTTKSMQTKSCIKNSTVYVVCCLCCLVVVPGPPMHMPPPGFRPGVSVVTSCGSNNMSRMPALGSVRICCQQEWV